MFEPYESYLQDRIQDPRQLRTALVGLSAVLSTIWQANQDHLSPESRLCCGILGSYLVGQGYPGEQAAHRAHQLIMAGLQADARSDDTSGPSTSTEAVSGLRASLTVKGAEAAETLRHLIETSINDEATAARLYANIADALQETGLTQAAEWVRGASRDEEKHLTLLQQRYRQLYHTTRQPHVGNTEVRDLRAALTEALGDEFTDAVKYRDAYLRYTNRRDQRIFFELMTDELRHATLFTYVIDLLK
jgi:rubrerythrin